VSTDTTNEEEQGSPAIEITPAESTVPIFQIADPTVPETTPVLPPDELIAAEATQQAARNAALARLAEAAGLSPEDINLIANG
jgi:hypothetical protein